MSRFFLLFYVLIFLLSVLYKPGTAVAQEQNEFTDTILAGLYPDPSICRVRAGYYLVNSTFSYFPGIPVFLAKTLCIGSISGMYWIDPGN